MSRNSQFSRYIAAFCAKYSHLYHLAHHLTLENDMLKYVHRQRRSYRFIAYFIIIILIILCHRSRKEETQAKPQSQLPAKTTESRLPYGEKSQHYYIKRVRVTKRKNIGEERRNPHMLFTAVTFIAFTALVAVIAWWRTRNDDLSTQDGYFLAGRSLTGPVIAGSLVRQRCRS